ncbi:ATP-dependent Clp protease adaptor ClpS [Blastopirellula marina]|uniref:Clp protease ClpS n=1 Tax=Blastopirellula marina TaxID=124 RepID=A0A2S8G1J5_9BACT|nr:ATP-dependent Clp protease adaptor ClpS [Blastopirellula marina]PQO38318.1 Clp protease ClpS [Blastopirellula marina]PTL44974.1 ATP-dependent Clp protease adaptor ClpS [Blastopirellula marina]
MSSEELSLQTRPKRQPPFGVILHNDDLNSFDYVIDSIRKVFHYELEKCFQLTLEAHETGRSLLWTGTLEGAELKQELLLSCGPDPIMLDKGGLPLKVTLEELPQ